MYRWKLLPWALDKHLSAHIISIFKWEEGEHTCSESQLPYLFFLKFSKSHLAACMYASYKPYIPKQQKTRSSTPFEICSTYSWERSCMKYYEYLHCKMKYYEYLRCKMKPGCQEHNSFYFVFYVLQMDDHRRWTCSID